MFLKCFVFIKGVYGLTVLQREARAARVCCKARCSVGQVPWLVEEERLRHDLGRGP